MNLIFGVSTYHINPQLLDSVQYSFSQKSEKSTSLRLLESLYTYIISQLFHSLLFSPFVIDLKKKILIFLHPVNFLRAFLTQCHQTVATRSVVQNNVSVSTCSHNAPRHMAPIATSHILFLFTHITPSWNRIDLCASLQLTSLSPIQHFTLVSSIALVNSFTDMEG